MPFKRREETNIVKEGNLIASLCYIIHFSLGILPVFFCFFFVFFLETEIFLFRIFKHLLYMYPVLVFLPYNPVCIIYWQQVLFCRQYIDCNCTSEQCPGPAVIKLFSCSTQLSMKFHLVMKMKIPSIKTFSCSTRWNKNTNNLNFFMLNQLSMLSWTWKKFKKCVSILRFISKANFILSWVEHEKKFYNLEPSCSKGYF